MEAPPPIDWRTPAPGRGWLVLAVVAAGLTGLHLLLAVAALVGGAPWAVFWTLAWALFWWWVHRGAWLRTERGRPPVGAAAPSAEPQLTDRRARWYLGLAATCAGAAAIAVSLQALVLSR